MNAIDRILGTETEVVLNACIGYYKGKVNNKEALMKFWKDGKDFRITRGPHCSIRDIEEIRHNFDRVYICAPGVEEVEV